MQERLILEGELFEVLIRRLAQQLIENHYPFDQTVLIGLQPRGIDLARRLKSVLESELDREIPMGQLDVTFYRDDFRRRDSPIQANKTDIPFIIEDKKVVLIDDVLYTGRTVRAALDAMLAFGRPLKVELLTLVDRKYVRDLPVMANYVGREVNTLKSQHVEVEWKENGFELDRIWLKNIN
ncbi:bifunctional pyr operon transcriptional regulator/uracil phosphoribosyltransferase PyrR [Aureibacter tunicatorum]|uniref:Pyrimidine operon attenuation protein/uracil phosphoribosyltransferase n=1 Tax=Aureibacter tunicatorum TaxID=866807 RepID=A0AAE4BSQ6_9BACT|nr:bifunctional pyr operon transcriptional regulator/uracil phosphoribosyltransferase PyrR [Aureibacter tunicatorum]MDR6240026.1 pyrimidine operon attenuation protein/uracil phosphoribosyltransferase [Aureibacter tunicatorum]BDD04498.1 bifunctional pyrimidine operon regulatory protein/uracil phosphoribosyltransferase [Aureibacter tunicatorum]